MIDQEDKLAFGKVQGVALSNEDTKLVHRLVSENSFKPEKDKAIFYSGDRGENELRASKAGLQPIQETQGGQQLKLPDRYELYGEKVAKALWKEASVEYAKSAEGKVITFVCGAKLNGTFRTAELEPLVKNEKVTEINGVPREHFQKAFRESPDKAFEEICKAELNQAKNLAMQKGDKASLDDVGKRSQAFQSQRERENSQTPPRSLEQNKPPEKSQEKSAASSGSTHPLIQKYGLVPDPAADKSKDKGLEKDDR